MQKAFRLRELDCASCAAKMERAIQKIKGVQSASVQFMSQRLIIEAEESDMKDIVSEATKVIAKIEPHCKIIC